MNIKHCSLNLKRLFVIGLAAIMGIALFAYPAFATDVETLVNKLTNKGVLSQEDANAILAQSHKEGPAAGLPDWVKKLDISGDLRLRYEYIDVQHQSIGPINRGRFRYRLNLSEQVVDDVKAVFGVSSDGGHSRSRNTTFGNTFGGKPIVINLAYAQYTPFKTLSFAAGKFPNPIWTPSMLTWDANITPEGASATFTPLTGDVSPFLNVDFLILDQLVNKSGFGAAMPFMVAIQPGVDLKFADNDKLRLAAAYYVFDNLRRTYQFSTNLPGVGPAQGGLAGPIGSIFGPVGTNNTLDAGKNLVYTYNDIWAGAQADFDKLSEILPYAALYGEYIYNPIPKTDHQGYIGGVKLGHSSIKPGLWQVDASYRRLERDSWLDIFPDADFFYGSTNVKGSRVSLAYGLARNVYSAVTWYNTNQISPNTAAKQTDTHRLNTVQVDLGMSF
jgi:hypothetical protein